MPRILHVTTLALALAATTAVAGCATGGTTADAAGTAGGAGPSTSVSGAVTDHVIVISIDGLRPDAIERYDARVLGRLMREGAHSLTARTIYPSKTLPSHTSMLTGVTPEVHGITWNSNRTDETGVVTVPTVFELAKDAGFNTAAFFSKSKLMHLVRPGSLDHVHTWRGVGAAPATHIVEAVTRYLQFRRPNLLFVHLAEPDAAGHSVGWMSFAYGWAVGRADGAVGRILEAADRSYGADNYTVIVTADHGGHGRDHGDDIDADMQIPWMSWGRGVNPGELADGIRTMDTAATVLWLLGVRAPTTWSGDAVASAFTASAQFAAAAAM